MSPQSSSFICVLREAGASFLSVTKLELDNEERGKLSSYDSQITILLVVALSVLILFVMLVHR
jgi:hypothetical protein